MTALDNKINQHFQGLVVRKDLIKAVKGNAIVPSYVLEYLLGQYCATNDEATIQSGIETVREILRKHYVHRNEAGLIRSHIKEKGRYKVIDKISVGLNANAGVYEAEFSNLGIKKVLVDSGTVKSNQKLLVGGVWCISDLEYMVSDDKNASPWILSSLKPIQLSQFDFESYTAARKQFSTDEWIDLLIQSIGFNPEMFGRRSKLIQLVRLIPFCERNYNIIELGPKGTGKSHIYSEFSPHGMLLSGGEVTVAKLFVNNNGGKIGLVGYWDTVAFDEFAGKQKKVDKALVDIMKNYLANKSFSRGIETLGGEASMAFVGNTLHTVPHMLKHADLFDELPEKYRDGAFLDRLHHFIPGWEVSILRPDLFSNGYGFVVDYLAEILRSLRGYDYSDRYKKHFSLHPTITVRDRDGINKTFSGLMKLLYPNGDATSDEICELLKFSVEGRKRVKDQIMFKIDDTFDKVEFSFQDQAGNSHAVKTLEEIQYPALYYKSLHSAEDAVAEIPTATVGANVTTTVAANASKTPKAQHLSYLENQKGVSFDDLFGSYLRGGTKIVITDPYIRLFYQLRNFMEFLETVVKHKDGDEDVSVHLITVEDEFKSDQQRENFERMKDECTAVGINLTWDFDLTGSIHARHIVLDNGWKILLDRGLDIFQRCEMNDAFSFSNRLQQHRPCKAFEVTYLRNEAEKP